MKKIIYVIPLIFAILLTSCSGKEASTENNTDSKDITTKSEENAMKDNTTKNVTTQEPAKEVAITVSPGTVGAATEDAGTEEAAAENTRTEDAATKDVGTKEDIKAAFTVSDIISVQSLTKRTDSCGSIQHISYATYDYFGDRSAITKYAYVYLPYDYDESKQYNVLYLMHGIGGSEKEWGLYDDSSQVKIMLDNLIYNGDIEPFIVVVPNGRSSVNFADSSSDHNSFYLFGKELRNDLIPYIESTYSTYAEYDKKGYDLTATRDHRAMAGLSMGGMQTINIGMCESLDIISYFGAFSACPTTYTSSKIATVLKDYPEYDINYFYNICGTEDNVALASASAAVSNLTSLTDKLTEDENFIWQNVSGGHAFNVWYLGFYNFAQIVFKYNTNQ